jgi:hypothetical protein
MTNNPATPALRREELAASIAEHFRSGTTPGDFLLTLGNVLDGRAESAATNHRDSARSERLYSLSARVLTLARACGGIEEDDDLAEDMNESMSFDIDALDYLLAFSTACKHLEGNEFADTAGGALALAESLPSPGHMRAGMLYQ